MLKNIFRKEKPRVYLGALTVIPRTGIKKDFDSWSLTGSIELDGSLKSNLIEIFCLPLSSSISDPLETDLVIDILITEFQLGAALFSDIAFPIFWRPKITLISKLCNIRSGKTITVISITEKMPWIQFVSRIFTLQGIMQLKPTFNNNDLEKLLYIASGKVMAKIKRSI